MKLKGFSNYEIYPEEGKVWSYNRKRYIGRKHKKKGYWFVTLSGDNGNVLSTSLHRVIWMAVNGEIPEGYEVNHINENKNNNSISNLNLLTPKENANWGTRNERTGVKNSKPILGLKDGKPSILFSSLVDAVYNGYKINTRYLTQNKIYKGYQWVYVADYLGIK